MKAFRTLLAMITVGLALGALSAPASAHGYYRGGYWGGPRVTFGFYGPGYWGPGYWGPGYGYPYGYGYAAPPVVVVPSEPRVYVERDGVAPSGQQQQWWYWCPSSRGYYPYVSTCSEGWQRVAPQPQGTQ